MARRKRTSATITLAETRAAGLASIDPALDLGDGKSLAAFNAKIKAVQGQLDDYNTKLGDLDGLKNAFEKGEKELDQMISDMLTAAGLKFTKDSTEYEKAGGTRVSERKPHAHKAKAAAPAK